MQEFGHEMRAIKQAHDDAIEAQKQRWRHKDIVSAWRLRC